MLADSDSGSDNDDDLVFRDTNGTTDAAPEREYVQNTFSAKCSICLLSNCFDFYLIYYLFIVVHTLL